MAAASTEEAYRNGVTTQGDIKEREWQPIELYMDGPKCLYIYVRIDLLVDSQSNHTGHTRMPKLIQLVSVIMTQFIW